MMLALALSVSLSASTADTTATSDSARSLRVPPWWEIRATASAEVFTTSLRPPWQWHSVAIRRRGITRSYGVEAFTARRHGATNGGAAVEGAARLGRRAYVEARAQLAPDATIIPRADMTLSISRPVGDAWELLLSPRALIFRDSRMPILGLGVARYVGLWYFAGRISDAIAAGEHGITTSVQARRYAEDASPDFIDASVAYGHEIVILAPDAAALRQTAAAGIRGQRMVSARLGLSAGLTYEANASLPDRRGGSVSGFVRW